jgi:hypothetical protein
VRLPTAGPPCHLFFTGTTGRCGTPRFVVGRVGTFTGISTRGGGGWDGDLLGDLHRENFEGVVNGELTGDLLRDGDDLDEGGAGDGRLDWAHPDSITPEAAALEAEAAHASTEINQRTTDGRGSPSRKGRDAAGGVAASNGECL